MKYRPYRAAKRTIDAITASVGLLALSPMVLAVAIAVRLRLGRPILFKQQRPGLDGKPFTLIKFRSMLPARGPSDTDDANRLTPFGAFLRSTSLDELPTLWNVVRGDMSLVGPRPLLTEYLPLYSARQATRHSVRPGITGLAQVNGRNDLDWNERLELDAEYVERLSFALDLRILARTALIVFRREGISKPGYATMPRFSPSKPRKGTGTIP